MTSENDVIVSVLTTDSFSKADKLSKIIRTYLEKKKGTTIRHQRLKEHIWGIGLEHEMHVFHNPLLTNNKNIRDFIAFNSFESTLELVDNFDKYSRDRPIGIIEKNFLENIPFEASGRKCKGKWVLKKIPIPMPEFVTDEPFSSLKNGKKSVEYYCKKIINSEEEFVHLQHANKTTRELTSRYGMLSHFPYGMTNYIKVPNSIKKNKYRFNKELSTDYTGSYHVTMTLPFKETCNKK